MSSDIRSSDHTGQSRKHLISSVCSRSSQPVRESLRPFAPCLCDLSACHCDTRYTPPKGRGYQALRNGSVVFVRTRKEDGSVCAPQQIMPVARVKRGLTQEGPPGNVWSWKVVRHKPPQPSLLGILAQASSSTRLENSFAGLRVTEIDERREVLRATDAAYNAVAYRSNTCPIEKERLRKAFKEANDDLNTDLNACNPFPSVDPAFKDYFEDPFDEDVCPLDCQDSC